MKFYNWNRIIHRDLGYFFVGMTIIYGLSGIALNHIRDWNPSYLIRNESYVFPEVKNQTSLSEFDMKELLSKIDMQNRYKSHYFPKPNALKIFVEGGSLQIDMTTGEGQLEMVSRRPIFYEVNYLHYNPGRWWIYFSDFFCGSLILLAITGLFIVKGKNGIKWRGAVLAVLGLLAPIVYLLFFA
jgi:uncharacterized protein